MNVLLVLRLLWKLNLTKTVYFNLKVFPWQIGMKFPVYFFGPVKFKSLKGVIRIDSPIIQRGMIQFGCDEENIITTNEPTRISVDGELIFRGNSKFSHSIQLLVWNNGKMSFGNNCWVGSFTKLVAFRSIDIGDNFLASWECQLFDTDFHFIENISNQSIADPNGIVVIGSHVWMGSRVTILKNTIIPSNCIIGVGSVCNKDYSSTCPPGSVIGGLPAKFIRDGVAYIDDRNLERKLFSYFQNSKNFNSAVSKSNIK